MGNLGRVLLSSSTTTTATRMQRSALSAIEEASKPAEPYRHPLQSKVIVITGAGSGIGRSCALLFATYGARLALTDSDSEAGKAVCAEISDLGLKTDVVFAKLDVRDEEGVGKLMRTFRRTYKRLDGLVCCAGINPPCPPLASAASTPSFYAGILDINLQGTINFNHHFLKMHVDEYRGKEKDESWVSRMGRALEDESEKGGLSIVNVGSVASLKGLANSAIYSASKHAIVGLSKSLARENAEFGVRVNVVAPGPIDTPLLHAHFDAEIHATTQTLQEHVNEVVPMKRMGSPMEVARCVCWLLGSESSFVTGAVVPVDGGWSV